MKRLSLFDQLQIRFPIRARTNVRRSAEAGAAAASMSKSGFGGSLLTNMAMSADAGGPFNRNAFVGREVYIERYIAKVGRVLFCNSRKKCHFLAAFALQFPCFRRLLVTVALLGIPLEQE